MTNNQNLTVASTFHLPASSICFVMPWHISEGRGGGAEVQTSLLAGELAKQGFTVDYICQTVNNNKVGTTSRFNNYTIHWIPNKSGKYQVFHMKMYGKKLYELNPDLVIQRMNSCVTGKIGSYCKKNNKTFVWFSTDIDSVSNKMHVQRQYRFYKTRKTKLINRVLLLALAQINDTVRNIGMKNINVCICQNKWQQNQLKPNFGLNAIILKSGHNSPKNISKENENLPVILWAGNLGSNKNPLAFLEMAMIHSNKKRKFTLIGKGTDFEIISKINQISVDNFSYKGHKSFEESLTYFDKCSVFVNTSVNEGFPNTFIQAWLRGVPVITLGVNPDNLITDHKLGFVCQSVQDASDKINELLSNHELYHEISENCLKYANEHHTIEKVTQQFIQHLSEHEY